MTIVSQVCFCFIKEKNENFVDDSTKYFVKLSSGLIVCKRETQNNIYDSFNKQIAYASSILFNLKLYCGTWRNVTYFKNIEQMK